MTRQTQHDIHFQVTDKQGLKTLLGDKVKDFTLLNIEKPDSNKTAYIVLHQGQTPTAYAQVYSSPWNESLEGLEVHPDHLGQRLGQIVLEEVFRYAEKRTGAIFINAYTPNGSKYLFPAIDSLEKKYPALNVIHHQSC